jgi:hypothetical protein
MRQPVTTGMAIAPSKDATRRPFFSLTLTHGHGGAARAIQAKRRVPMETPRRHAGGALG